MEVKSEYTMNEEFVLMMGNYDGLGNRITRVVNGKDEILVNKPFLNIIDKNLLRLGSDFAGALHSSKDVLGSNIKMHPLKINKKLEIWLLPTKSYKHHKCVIFSLMHIKNVRPLGVKKTEVTTSYGHTIEIDMKFSAFNHKRQKAHDLRDIMSRNIDSPSNSDIKPIKGFYIHENSGEFKFTKYGEDD
ncbi:competence protein ComK [Neobacillus cucumis]|nr:competence protein ComK [Neobacillus cucumis]